MATTTGSGGVSSARRGSEDGEQERQKLAGELLGLYDAERRSIARELHDTTAQNLAALSMNLGLLAGALEQPRRSRTILAECVSLTDECLKEVRSLAYMLHPPLLDEMGLEAAGRTFIDLYQRRTGVSVDLELRTPIGRLAPRLELTVFRIMQESLFNVHRHSGSPKAHVEMGRHRPEFEIIVRDWGTGMGSGSVSSKSLGIAGMRERARALGGRLEISAAEPGTVVRALFRTEQ